VKYSENFDTRIAQIGVAVAKIWRKGFWGPICNFWRVARTIFEIIFRFQGSVIEIVECVLISNKDRGIFAKLD
jgi:hypothetical protein